MEDLIRHEIGNVLECIGKALQSVDTLSENSRQPNAFLALDEAERLLRAAELKMHEARKVYEQEIT